MVNEKHMFALAALLMLAFVGFMFANSGSRNSGAGAVEENVSGADHPIDTTIPETKSPPQSSPPSTETQVVKLHASAYGYDRPSITVKAGQPVLFQFSADANAGCGRQVIIDNVGVNLVSRNGETVSATFTPPSPGQYGFHCGMYMFRGVLIAT